MSTPRRRPMRRIGDLIPDAARGARARGRAPAGAGDRDVRGARRRARARPPPARAGSSGIEGFALDVEADAPIVAQELRLRASELLAAFAAAPGGVGVRELRVHVRRGGPRV